MSGPVFGLMDLPWMVGIGALICLPYIFAEWWFEREIKRIKEGRDD